MTEPHYQPFVSITANKMVNYVQNQMPSNRRYKSNLNLKHGFIAKTSETLSKQQLSKIKNQVSLITAAAKKKHLYYGKEKTKIKYSLGFATLTLSSNQNHTDSEIYNKCLAPLLQKLQSKFEGLRYFWRAETQTNGNIHYHIILNRYIHWTVLKREWNLCQNYLGYVDRFMEKNGHNEPNSTDIHAIKNIKNIAAYLVKYLSKEQKRRVVVGRVYGSDNATKKYCKYVIERTNEVWNEIAWIFERYKSMVFYNDFSSGIYCDVKKLLDKHKGVLYKTFTNNLTEYMTYGTQPDLLDILQEN